MSLKASITSPRLHLQFAFPLMLPSSSTVAWATLVYPSSRKWSLVFHLCRRLRVSPVNLGNILVSRSQSIWIIGQSLLLNSSTLRFGVLVGPRLLEDISILLLSLMTILDVLGYFKWKIKLSYSLFSRNFMLKSKPSSIFLFVYYAVTMSGNIFLHHLLHLCPNMGSFISLLVLILNKMG